MKKFILAGVAAFWMAAQAGAACTTLGSGLGLKLPNYGDRGDVWAKCVRDNFQAMNDGLFTSTSAVNYVLKATPQMTGGLMSTSWANFASSVTAGGNIYGAIFYGSGAGLTALPAAQLTGGVPTTSVDLSTVTTALSGKVAKAGDFMSGQLTTTSSMTATDLALRGTTNPSIKLQGNNENNGGHIYFKQSADAPSAWSWDLWHGVASDNRLFLYRRGPADEYTYSQTWLQNGDVGIGSIYAPKNKLHVEGGLYVLSSATVDGGFYGNGATLTGVVKTAGDTMTGQLTLVGSTLTVGGNAFSVGGSTVNCVYGKCGIGIVPVQTYAGYLLQLGDPGASQGYVSIGYGASNTGPLKGLVMGADTSAAHIVNRDNTYLEFMTNNAHAFNILPTGEMNIASAYDSARRARLHVRDVASDNYALLVSSQDLSSMFSVDKAGRVGIGDTTPDAALDVIGGVTIGQQNHPGWEANALNMDFTEGAGARGRIVSGNSGANILTLNEAGGNVGISSTTPTAALAVSGGIVASSSVTAQGGFFGSGAALSDVSNLVSSVTVSVATGTITFSGLDGNADGPYYMVFASSCSTTLMPYRLFFNGDFTSSNYWDQVLTVNDTTAGGARENSSRFMWTPIISSPIHVFGEARIYRGANGRITFTTNSSAENSGSDMFMQSSRGVHTAVQTNVTSISLATDNDRFLVGTRVELYRSR